jgi:hypothetical protein
MSSLYNIIEEHLQLLNNLENVIADTDFEVNTLEDVAKEELSALEINREELNQKIKSYYYFTKQKEGEIAVINDELNRLANLRKTKENVIQALKDRVDIALKIFGEKTDKGNFKLKCDNLSVWNVHTKPLILEEGFEKDEYGKYVCSLDLTKEQVKELQAIHGDLVKVDYRPDKKLIKLLLEEGKQIEGAEIDKNASYVRFK